MGCRAHRDVAAHDPTHVVRRLGVGLASQAFGVTLRALGALQRAPHPRGGVYRAGVNEPIARAAQQLDSGPDVLQVAILVFAELHGTSLSALSRRRRNSPRSRARLAYGVGRPHGWPSAIIVWWHSQQ